METILSIWNYISLHPVSNGIQALLEQVLVPSGTAFMNWIQEYLPWCTSFADFCTALFKLKYKGRIYSFMILLPVAVIVIFITRITRRRIRRVRRIKK